MVACEKVIILPVPDFVRVPDPQNVGDPQNAGLGSGTSRQQNSHVEVNVLLSA